MPSKRQDWRTPRKLFDALNQEFHFTLDAAASPHNALCPSYFTEEVDALKQDWGLERVFCNPPYKNPAPWIKKAHDQSTRGTLTVMLLPATTDTKAWHRYIFNQVDAHVEVRFLEGRLHFSDAGPARFPSAVVIFHPIV